MQRKLWRVSACSVQGVSHIKTDQPCQDSNEWRAGENGYLYAAVADGAGSAKESLRGATLACRVAVEHLEGKKASDDLCAVLKEAFSKAREAVIAEAEKSKLPIRELSCTLILMVAWAEGAAAAQVGDGAALVQKPDGELHSLTVPAQTEYLNETTFITADDAFDVLQTKRYDSEVKGVAMFTDGLQLLALKMPDAQPHQPFFKPLFKFVESQADDVSRQEQLEKFLKAPRITERADDDLTLLLATLQQAGA